MRIALIDNYDSFTYNLVHALGMEGARVEVYRNDAMSAAELLALGREGQGYEGIVLSPGPCTPNEAGITLDVIRQGAGKVPMLGVCLGHQAMGQAFGGTVVRAAPVHGKVSRITHDGSGLFRGINGALNVTRYHSLVVEAASLPACLVPNAHSEDGFIMAMAHRDFPLWGVQFHPESIATEQGAMICRNFLDLARAFHARPQAA